MGYRCRLVRQFIPLALEIAPPGGINRTEKVRQGTEGQMGRATVVLPYVGHQMLNFTLIYYSSGLGLVSLA